MQDRDDQYSAYSVTKAGMEWLLDNQERLNLSVAKDENATEEAVAFEDDIPF